MPTQSLRPKQAQPNARQQLKVQQLLIPEIEQLQQKELQAQLPLSINKTDNLRAKPTPNPKARTNSLEAPYKKPTAKPQAKPKKSTQKNKFKPQVKKLPIEAKKEPSLEQQKTEMVEWLENVQIH